MSKKLKVQHSDKRTFGSDIKGLSDLLELVSYQKLSESMGAWISTEGDFCVFIKLTGIDPVTMTSEDFYETSNRLNRAFQTLPGGCSGQLLYFKNNDVRQKLRRYMGNSVKEDGVSNVITRSVVKKQLEGANSKSGFYAPLVDESIAQSLKAASNELVEKKHFVFDVDPLPVVGKYALEHDIYLVVRITPDMQEPELFKGQQYLKMLLGITNRTEIAVKQWVKAQGLIVRYMEKFLQYLDGTGLNPRVLGADGAISFIWSLLNPQKRLDSDPPPYQDGASIMSCLGLEPTPSKHCISSYVGMSDIKFDQEGMTVSAPNESDVYYRVVSAGLLPRHTVPGQLQQYLYGEEGEGLTVVNFYARTNAEQFRSIFTKKMEARFMQGLWEQVPFVDKSSYFERVNADLAEYEAIVDPDNIESGQRAVDLSFHHICIGKDKLEVERRAKLLEFKMNDSGRFERFRGNTVIRSSLPGNFLPSQMDEIGRTEGYTSGVLADMSPIYTDFQGYSTSSFLANNRSGTPIFLDTFGAPKTSHGIVVGGTGTGKTFMYLNMLTQMFAQEPMKVFLVDKGRGFESFVNLFGGSYYDLDVDDDRSKLNPFIIFYTEEGVPRAPLSSEMATIVQTLKQMVLAIHKEREFNAHEIGLMNETIYQYFESKPLDEQGTLSDFVKLLRTRSSEFASGMKIADELSSFYGNGLYSKMFDGVSDNSWDDDVVAFETSRIPAVLLPVVMLTLMSNIDSYTKSKLPRGTKKVLGIDEAWSVFGLDGMLDMLAGFLREMRKYTMGVFLLSQTVTEFVKLISKESDSDSDGVLANIANYFFLPVSESDYKSAESELGFEPRHVDAWKTLKSAPPYYSEVFYRHRLKNDTYQNIIFRLIASSVAMWIAESRGAGFDLRKQTIERFMNDGFDKQTATAKALEQLSEQYPYGYGVLVDPKSQDSGVAA